MDPKWSQLKKCDQCSNLEWSDFRWAQPIVPITNVCLLLQEDTHNNGKIYTGFIFPYIWVKSCRTGKKCSECPNFTLTQRFTLSKPSILQTWVFYPVGYLCLGHLHKNFHLPGIIFKGRKFKGKIIKNWPFWHFLPLKFRPLKMVPGKSMKLGSIWVNAAENLRRDMEIIWKAYVMRGIGTKRPYPATFGTPSAEGVMSQSNGLLWQ